MPKLRLGINIDHIATVRNARKRDPHAAPDLLRGALEAIKGGADSITFHLREDRRHILDDDARQLCKQLRKPINLEIAPTHEMTAVALSLRPHAVCLVPEKRKEITTEGGLDVVNGGPRIARIVNKLAAAGIRVSLFIAPEAGQVFAAWTTGAAAVEFHTGSYAHASKTGCAKELRRLKWAAEQAHKLGLEVHAGHGLTYENVRPIASIPQIVELNIGHFLVGEAIFVGLRESTRTMRKLMNKARIHK